MNYYKESFSFEGQYEILRDYKYEEILSIIKKEGFNNLTELKPFLKENCLIINEYADKNLGVVFISQDKICYYQEGILTNLFEEEIRQGHHQVFEYDVISQPSYTVTFGVAVVPRYYP